ncbi:MAG: hypothetical protein HY929_01075 [Euryarchaeota archaeon]|nr:hypothetical protein [Euryarchaeota archaeon]
MEDKLVKRAIGHFRNIIDHSLKPYEPTPEHVLKRLITPLCADLKLLSEVMTGKDAKEVITGFSSECHQIFKNK